MAAAATQRSLPYDCPLCFETYASHGNGVPLMIPCGHTVCRGCLRKNECPFCRKAFTAKIADLPTNYSLIPPDSYSKSAAQFDLDRVRDMAKRAMLQQIYLNEASRVISFAPIRSPQHQPSATWGPSGGRINIYYTTRTVGTCLDHPKKGKTQLFRTAVSDELLLELMYNPRAHTGVGYQRAPKAAQLSQKEAEAAPSDEEAELGAQARRIEALIAPYQTALQEVQTSLNLLKRKREQGEEEEKVRQEAQAKLRLAQEKQREEEEAERKRALESRRPEKKARGRGRGRWHGKGR